MTLPAAARAAELMRDLANATIDPVVLDLYPGKPEKRTIVYDPALANRLLGMEIPRAEQLRVLRALAFDVADTGTEWTVTVPSYRLDVGLPVDLVEEVARVWGYDRFPETLIDEELPPLRRNHALEAEEHLRDLLVGLGLDEVISYSLIDPQEERRLQSEPGVPLSLPGACVVLQNPLAPERSLMRRTLLSGGAPHGLGQPALSGSRRHLRDRAHPLPRECARCGDG